MHLERNVSTSILGFILGKKDIVGVCANIEHAGINTKLHMKKQTKWNVYLKPHAPYSLKVGEIPRFMKKLSAIKTPTNFMSSNLAGHINESKLQGLKSHNHHLLL